MDTDIIWIILKKSFDPLDHEARQDKMSRFLNIGNYFILF